MELSVFFKSVIDQDRAPVVLCDLDHIIIYMNPAAVRNYAKRGGEKLIGQSLLAALAGADSKDGCVVPRKSGAQHHLRISQRKRQPRCLYGCPARCERCVDRVLRKTRIQKSRDGEPVCFRG